jgi:hypothetical protein
MMIISRTTILGSGREADLCCLSQNVYNPEFYVAEYDMTNPQTGERVRACGRFADTIKTMPGFTADLSGPTATTEERLPLHCVSIPGESAWVRELLRGPAPPAAAAAASSSTVGATNKRPLEDEDEEMQGDVMEEDAPAGQKKPKQEGAAAKQAPVKGGTLKEGEHAAIVKVMMTTTNRTQPFPFKETSRAARISCAKAQST